MNAYIYIQNGVYLEAKAFGKGGTCFGDIVFNTSVSGYQEAISNPFYKGKFIVFTMPEIGAVGANEVDVLSDKIHASGIFIRSLSAIPSNFRATKTLEEFLAQNDKFGVYDIDTRYLTKMIRENRNLKAVVSTQIKDKEKLKRLLDDFIESGKL